MNTPYTPGQLSSSEVHIRSEIGDLIGEACRASLKPSSLPSYEEACANARLWAASPELAEALVEMKRLLNIALEFEGDVFGVHHNSVMDALSDTDAAIQKAGLL